MAKDKKGVFRGLAVGSLLNRFALAARAGQTFGGKRDLYNIFGYKAKLEYVDFLARYVRQDIAKRIVKAPPAATWIGKPKISGAGAAFDTAWKKLVTKHSLWAKLEKADRLAGIGQFGILLVGYSDSGALDQPVRTGEGGTEILYLQPYTEGSVSILKFISNPQDPRFALPEIYEIDAADPDTASIKTGSTTVRTKSKTFKVHHTRVLHIAEDTLEDGVLGTPRLSCVYNLLDDLLKIAGGSAETYWLAGNRGMQADIDKEMELTPEDEKALSDEIEEYQHELRRFIRTRGVTLKPMGSDVADPQGVFGVTISLISAATGMPRRILLGAEAGQLASEQDRANWADRISERQIDFAEPEILRPFIAMNVNAKALPEPNEDYEVEWPSAFRMSPLEEAQMMAQQARAAINLSKQGQAGDPITTLEEARAILLLPRVPKATDTLLTGPTEPEVDEEEDEEDAQEELDDDNITPISEAQNQ